MYDNTYINYSNLADRIIKGELTLEQRAKTDQEEEQRSFFSRKEDQARQVEQEVQEYEPEDINDVMMDYMVAFRQGNIEMESGGSMADVPDVGQHTYTGPRGELPQSKVDYGRIAQGIQEAADALGVNAHDLATIISYETAGTFNPTKRGPTTQWGQHKGLIQFGEPQARENGVDWSDPYGSQLGANGTVNAGAPGLYNRSDANNGGAPGTVRDKVENQMAGHKAKARTLLEDYGFA